MTPEQEQFRNLPPEEQRVAIAKDVLKQMKLKKIKPSHGVYLDLTGSVPISGDEQVCDVLANKHCEVCALGGMMVAAVMKADDLKVSQLYLQSENLYAIGGNDCSSYLSRFFTHDQLKQIEAAFERWTECDGQDVKPFAPEARGAVKRMTLVMKNIIKNNGTFVWPASP
jgi:hypothetical protein